MKNKDYNYVAAVEKAIAEKYGRNAAQDFRGDWHPDKEKEYLNQLKEANLKSGEHKRRATFSERTCPVCKTYSFSGKDDLYMNRFMCCHRCYIDFVEGKTEDWKKGWRPSAEEVAASLTRRKNNG
jgi:hypothetical protein